MRGFDDGVESLSIYFLLKGLNSLHLFPLQIPLSFLFRLLVVQPLHLPPNLFEFKEIDFLSYLMSFPFQLLELIVSLLGQHFAFGLFTAFHCLVNTLLLVFYCFNRLLPGPSLCFQGLV